MYGYLNDILDFPTYILQQQTTSPMLRMASLFPITKEKEKS